jgi:hypothetical protein
LKLAHEGDEGVSVTQDEYFTKITGLLTNNCGRDLTYVEITYKLYDRAGNVVGTALANQDNLKAGEIWRFSALGRSGVFRYELEKVTAY